MAVSLAIIAALILGVAAFIWITAAALGAAEKKLGRELEHWEAFVIGATIPYSLAFIVLMPSSTKEGE